MNPLIEIIEITGAGSELQGVGRAQDGRAVFVPGAIPGETVRAEIVKQSDRFCEARLIDVMHPSEDRVRPECPYYGECGGCQTQHMRTSRALELKQQKVADALARIGGVSDYAMRPIIGAPRRRASRNKAEYAVNGGIVGCYKMNSRQIVPVDRCLLQHPVSGEILSIFRAWLQAEQTKGIRWLVTRVNHRGESMAIVSADRSVRLDSLADRLFRSVEGMRSLCLCHLAPRPTHALDGRCQTVRGDDVLIDRLSELEFELSPQSFFQVNPPQAEALYGAALEAAGLTNRELVVDAYCGAGTITLSMARAARKAIGIEVVRPAVDNARRNARRNGLEAKAECIAGRAEEMLPELVGSGLSIDVLTVDPPRKGLDEKLIAAALRARPERIVYVSCNPATLARDIKRFIENDAYRAQWVQPVDMFPWTGHVECVVSLERRKKTSR